MRADQTFLQLRALFLGDGSGGERAESGGDTVMRHGVVGQMIDNRATQRHLMLRFVRNRHFGTAARYGDNVLDAQRSNTYGDRLLCHAHTFLYMCRIPHSAYTAYAAYASPGIRDCPHSLTAPAHQQQATQTRPIAPRVIKPWPFHLSRMPAISHFVHLVSEISDM